MSLGWIRVEGREEKDHQRRRPHCGRWQRAQAGGRGTNHAAVAAAAAGEGVEELAVNPNSPPPYAALDWA